MPRFLTPAWVAVFNQAMASVAVPTPGADAGLVPQSGRFVVAQEIRGAPGGDVTLLLRVDDGKMEMALAPVGDREEGAEPGPNVTISLSYDDAAAMAKGELSPAEALTAGRVRVRGDLAVLIAGQELMAEARRQTGSLAAETSY